MVHIENVPWIPLRAGLSFKPLRFFPDDRGSTILLRVEPGTVIGRHRHTGEVHAFHLEGERKLLDTGEVLGAGSYLYEPPGNIDEWMAVGDRPLIAFVTVTGAIEYLDDQDQVVSSANAKKQLESYRRYCQEHDLPMVELGQLQNR